MYVVCDERDAILRRIKYSVGHDCYLYRLQTDSIQSHAVFQEYADATHEIYDRPKWYNALTSNCTTTIYMHLQRKMAWDWRIVFNGNFDKMMYDWGRLFNSLPFDELKKKSWIKDVANTATWDNFSEQICGGLPGFDH